MDIFSIFTAWEWIWAIIDKIIDLFKLWKNKKQDEKNKDIIKSKLRSIYNNHKNQIKALFTELLDDMKKDILKDKDKNSSFFLNKIEEVKKWDLIENINNKIDEWKNNKMLIFIWKTFFYDNKIKEIQNDININIDNFISIYFREAKNYFESWKKADTKLLLNEKKEILKLLEKSIYDFEKIILEKFEWLVKLSIKNSINPNSSINDDNIANMIKNVDKLANDIKDWKMKKYYTRILNILDTMINEMIEKIKK